MVYLPGDVLLYSRASLYDWIIRAKTWSAVSHCEVVETSAFNILNTFTVASRNGKGVERYRFEPEGLKYVLRPTMPFDTKAAYRWFTSVRGQGYDWVGLLAFENAKWQGRENGKQFCSEFATRYLRAGGFDPFNGYDADGIAPGEFLKSPVFQKLSAEVRAAQV